MASDPTLEFDLQSYLDRTGQFSSAYGYVRSSESCTPQELLRRAQAELARRQEAIGERIQEAQRETPAELVLPHETDDMAELTVRTVPEGVLLRGDEIGGPSGQTTIVLSPASARDLRDWLSAYLRRTSP